MNLKTNFYHNNMNYNNLLNQKTETNRKSQFLTKKFNMNQN